MASSSSSSSSRIRRYHVFPSFHGPDVRRTFLSHLHRHFTNKGITTFKDQEIERGQTIVPELVQAIRESKVSVVLLSKNYASSSWCLDELVEILKCREDQGQMMMTIFYDVDPSDVRKQSGRFGSAFEKACEGKPMEVKQRWTEALAYVATVAGEHSLNWTDEAGMVEKFVTDVSNKLNVTLSRDYDGVVGLQSHLRKLNALLCLECNEVKMIGIWGPAGIGKSTIARVLFCQLSTDFPLGCFMGNLKGGYKSIIGVDDYDLKLGLQNQLLSKILNQRDMRVYHLGSIKEWLQDQRVLIVLDDVDDLDTLDVLAKELSWFGLGSRIIVTTEDKKILKAHGVPDTYQYHVDFPSSKEAVEILCLSAFNHSSPREGFEEVANKVAKLCGNLPLGLCVVGSSLRGESKQEWELQLSRIETSLDAKIIDVLRVGYDRLSKKDQSIFLHVASIFNNNGFLYVKAMLANSNLDFENGLKTLDLKSLVDISFGWIEMHSLLQQLGRQVVYEQSDEPGKRQFLVEADEICTVLANETGTGSVIGISLDTSKVGGMISISGRAFEGMRNLRFLRFYMGSYNENASFPCILGDLTYLPRLSMLDWAFYPGKRLPSTFQPECLVTLRMTHSNLEKLWGGIQPLANLNEMDLSFSYKLKEMPNLTNATNLETLTLTGTSLVELPSSIKNSHRLKELKMSYCTKLRVIPTNNINLASLEKVDMNGCSRLRTFPNISSNIEYLDVGNTKIEDVPASVAERWSRLKYLIIGNKSLKRLTHVPINVIYLDLSNSDIKRIPDCVIGLRHLHDLIIRNCRKLVSLQSLPLSVWLLDATDCGSLKSVRFLLSASRAYSTTPNKCNDVNLEKEERRASSIFHPFRKSMFRNCLKLDEEARRLIIQRWDRCSFFEKS
ncbi:disease resistance protein RML1A-like [Brassica napus]|uniref:disease resistance protein RML1A-like n=1 Tax=Brassica napus TaxID=3708 RepID=UPI00207A7A93|nr:disease resistance protein RML1A-like [Brassica napus]